ncbi:MAG: hypothetical protein IJP58_01335, partial [Clostridia bacterium]|nr:hypothetical protein [Clostridia bacterium]
MSTEQTNVKINNEIRDEDRLALYVLRSGQGVVHGGITSNMTSEIQLYDEYVKFGIFPKKYNRVPEMRYEDIASIEI